MRAYRSISLMVLALCLGAAARAQAQTASVLFTRVYVREAGQPVVAADRFAACDPAGRFSLVVINGPEGYTRVDSASVMVNGVEVVREADFNEQVGRLERPLPGLASDNRLDVRVRSGPGAAIRVTVQGTQACGLRLTHPAPGSVVAEGLLVVRGTVPVPPDGQVGVTVNGVPAVVEGGAFVAVVAVEPTVTALTAQVYDLDGPQASETVGVSVVPAAGEPPVVLLVDRNGGAPPFVARFRLAAVVPVRSVAFDADGDGVVDFQGAGLDGRSVTYAQPGVYVPAVAVTDDQGRVHRAVAVVHVVDPAALDRRLQAVWEGFRAALRAGDVGRAAMFLHSSTRARYQEQLSLLGPAALAAIDQDLTPIRLVEAGFAGAQYEMLRVEEGTELSYAVWFHLDDDGLWRLRRF